MTSFYILSWKKKNRKKSNMDMKYTKKKNKGKCTYLLFMISFQVSPFFGFFVTAGTKEKQLFLENEYGIARDHILSSQSITFSTDVLNNTNGRGVDVALNSLTGDLFQESLGAV
jgi:hypothetical protein